MKNSQFIFSDDRKYRVQRHLSFWVFWWLFMGFLYSFVPVARNIGGSQLLLSMLDAIIYMPPHMFLTYSLIYFIIPKYLVKGKYIASACLVLVAFLITALFSNLIYFNLLTPFNKLFLSIAKKVSALYYLQVVLISVFHHQQQYSST